MTYVPKYRGKPLKEPKSVIGHVWRFQMLSNRIDGTTSLKFRTIYRIRRSVNLMKAERLGAARFQEVCLRLAISNDAIERHRRIAANSHRLEGWADCLPDSDEALSIAADIESRGFFRLSYDDRKHLKPQMSLDDLREIVRKSKSAVFEIASEDQFERP
jgi:hypothetical protein